MVDMGKSLRQVSADMFEYFDGGPVDNTLSFFEFIPLSDGSTVALKVEAKRFSEGTTINERIDWLHGVTDEKV